MPPRAPEKKQTLLAFLKRGVAMLHLDARRPGVSVPEQFVGDAHLRLNLSYRYAIPDFEVGDERVEATLSFGGRPFHCVLPWEAVFAVTSSGTGEGQVWPEDLPTEAARGFGEPSSSPAPEARPRLAAVEGEPASQRQGPREPPPDAPKRSHLRLVR